MASAPEHSAVPEAVDVAEMAYRRAERARWGTQPRCPHCAGGRAYFLTPPRGARRTRTGRPSARRVWKCAACRRQFSVLTATVWHGTRLPLPTWLAVLGGCARAGVVPGAHELRADFALSAEAARHVRRLLNAALACPEVVAASGGSADELLATLLRLDALTAGELRRDSVRRARPLHQHGPSADYGTA